MSTLQLLEDPAMSAHTRELFATASACGFEIGLCRHTDGYARRYLMSFRLGHKDATVILDARGHFYEAAGHNGRYWRPARERQWSARKALNSFLAYLPTA